MSALYLVLINTVDCEIVFLIWMACLRKKLEFKTNYEYKTTKENVCYPFVKVLNSNAYFCFVHKKINITQHGSLSVMETIYISFFSNLDNS